MQRRVGIILSGGLGTRLYPLTKVLSKQILPVYNKPMIYYPLKTLIDTGHKNILIITKRNDIEIFKKQIGNGSAYNCNITYLIQSSPRGIPDAFLIAQKYIKDKSVTLILGDNILFYKKSNIKNLINTSDENKIFLKKVKNPEEFGIAKLKSNKIVEIEEKPYKPKSNFAIIGLYLFDKDVVRNTLKLSKSKRSELEIIDLIKIYLNSNKLCYAVLGKEFTWFDAGTFDNLYFASKFAKNFINDKK